MLFVGLGLGSAGRCGRTKTPEPQAPPVVELEPEAPPEPEIDPTPEPEPEPTRPPPWSPPEETLLPGLDGAGQLLARGDAEGALARLEADGLLPPFPKPSEGEAETEAEAEAEAGTTEQPEVARHPAEGDPEWFLAGAIAGRAYVETEQWDEAVAVLEALAANKHFAEELPRDWVGFELAKARVAYAARIQNSGGMDRSEADYQLNAAVSELSALKKLKPDRIHGAMRVLQGEAMAAIDGAPASEPTQGLDPNERTPEQIAKAEKAAAKGRKRAAQKADKALERLIASFPNHPRVGEWMLLKARAQLRAGQRSEGAAALRHIAIMRAGEPEADQAWTELEALAAEHESIDAGEFSTREALDAGQAARVLRRLDRSKELLEPIWTADSMPRHLRREAGNSLAWTLYKNREYSACADIFAALYEQVPSADTRRDRSRCLERAARYDEAIDMWVATFEGTSRGSAANALWNALTLAVNGGRYDRALELLEMFDARFQSRGADRRWLRAWLPMRAGDDALALERFTALVEGGRAGSRDRAARYFLGKLELASDDAAVRAQGAERLQALVTEGDARMTAGGVIGGFPIYYGLMARARLVEAGESVPEPPAIPVPEWSERHIGHAETLDHLSRFADEQGAAFSSLTRAEQLLRAGWREEAAHEFRVAIDEYINTRATWSGTPMPGTRSEALVRGLAWESEWSQPKAVASRAARKAMRGEESRAALDERFRVLAWALDEPYRFAKLSPYGQPYRSRWLLRSYREPIERHAHAREVDPTHLWALMYTESRYRRHVVSHVGARGALQIMPWTGRQLAEGLGELEVGQAFDPDQLFVIEDNSRLAARYVSELMVKFHDQPTFAYASYNGGPVNVARWLAAKGPGSTTGRVGLDEYIEEIPFSETSKYARRVMETRAMFEWMYEGELPVWTNEVDPVYEDNIWF